MLLAHSSVVLITNERQEGNQLVMKNVHSSEQQLYNLNTMFPSDCSVCVKGIDPMFSQPCVGIK